MKNELHAHSLARQGVWLQWSDKTIPFDFSWKNLLFGPGKKVLKFVLNVSVNWVKIPDLLKLWGYTHKDLCCLCGSSGCTIHHILSNCTVALKQLIRLPLYELAIQYRNPSPSVKSVAYLMLLLTGRLE